jgi:hypothetical protein
MRLIADLALLSPLMLLWLRTAMARCGHGRHDRAVADRANADALALLRSIHFDQAR